MDHQHPLEKVTRHPHLFTGYIRLPKHLCHSRMLRVFMRQTWNEFLYTGSYVMTTYHGDIQCAPGWACVDCTILHANGEAPTDMSPDDYAEWEAGVTASTHGYNFTLGLVSDEHADTCTPDDREAGCDVSTIRSARSFCVMCSRRIAGEAHAMTPWRIQPQLQYIEADDYYRGVLTA